MPSTDSNGNVKCPICGSTSNISGPEKDKKLGNYVWTCNDCPGSGHKFS